MASMKRAGCVCALVGAVVGCSGASQSSEESGMAGEPIIGGTLASQYPEAAYLNIDFTAAGGYLCSATLIAPKVVLTAGHCVDTHSKWEVHVGAASQVSTSGVTYDWNEHGASTVNPLHHDIGLVFLAQSIPIPGYPTIAAAPLADGSKVTNVGRIKDGAITNALYAADTTVKAAGAIGYPLDYLSSDVIQPGDSGGPDFASGSHVIVAVNSGAGGSTEVLARVDLLASWIAQQIAAHGGAGPAADGGSPSADAATPPPSPMDAGAPSKEAAAPPPVDAGAPARDAGPPPAPPLDAGAPSKDGAPPPGACAPETEPNGSFSQATALAAGATCGSLGVSDQDWYSVSATDGTISIALVAAGDALLSVGQSTGNGCTPSLTGLGAVQLTSAYSEHLCVLVASPSQAAQSYVIVRR
jgi:V8-like Glu-specific endopeptidase